MDKAKRISDEKTQRIVKQTNKSKQLHIRLTENEYNTIHDIMNLLGYKISLTDFIMKCIKQGSIYVIDNLLMRNMIFEMNKIGNNINQIASLCNKHGYVDKDVLKIIIKKQNELNHLVYNFMIDTNIYHEISIKKEFDKNGCN